MDSHPLPSSATNPDASNSHDPRYFQDSFSSNQNIQENPHTESQYIENHPEHTPLSSEYNTGQQHYHPPPNGGHYSQHHMPIQYENPHHLQQPTVYDVNMNGQYTHIPPENYDSNQQMHTANQGNYDMQVYQEPKSQSMPEGTHRPDQYISSDTDYNSQTRSSSTEHQHNPVPSQGENYYGSTLPPGQQQYYNHPSHVTILIKISM